MAPKVVIIPGNGDCDINSSNFYGWVRSKLQEGGIKCEAQNMPDPLYAREEYWIPFMHDKLQCDENTIVIGHSSGAEAAMRYAEQYKVLGVILVSACVTDMGDEFERASGYYNRPWLWDKIKNNAGFIAQFGSEDDPLVPWAEQKQVAEALQTDMNKFTDRGHFMSSTFPELVNVVKKYVQKAG